MSKRPRRYLPSQQEHRYQMQNHSNKGLVIKGNATLPNIFNKQHNAKCIGGNRMYCTYTERKAIYKDVNGNKVVLQENETLFNGTEAMGAVQFTTPKKRFTKR